ncbi:surface membrane protein gp46-like protein [Novymonas esmeraldas]|uniref:Surface membrane protein gp46-like protein n=1 Tax=Novymonas esmeraldas TaxID=1808958 RepID=A0AAW0F0X5_9TRYP
MLRHHAAVSRGLAPPLHSAAHCSTTVAVLRLTLVVAMLLLLCGAAPAESAYVDMTPGQQLNTRKFLQAFVAANPLLLPVPPGDFCQWTYADCTSKGVDLYLDETKTMRLPELPAGVVPNQVIVTSISISYGKGMLSGTLPASWGSLSRIEYLSLYSNSLTGTLPPEWVNMKTVKWFLLNDNNLTGTIPAVWSRLRFMSWTCFNNNSLTGTLPDSWGSAQRLTIVEAKNNQLSGTLPSTWSSLEFISSISLANNLLSGGLPDTWASATTLNGVSVTGNDLCGCVPSAWDSHEFIYGVRVDDAVASPTCAVTNPCK